MKSHIEELKQKAADGDADAQYTLGAMYLLGLGVDQDEKEADKWLALVKKSSNRRKINESNNK